MHLISAADIYKKMIRKRVLSVKQAEFRQRMNRRMLNHAARLADDSAGPPVWMLDEAALTSALDHRVISAWEHSFYSSNVGTTRVTEKQEPIKKRIEAKVASWTRERDATPTA